jgi:hypothetical protein
LLSDALYYVCDGADAAHLKLSPVQASAQRFEDAEHVRDKIREIARGGHAWADRMRPVRLVGVRTLKRSRDKAAS